jgi:Ca-activated chloride channel family protein
MKSQKRFISGLVIATFVVTSILSSQTLPAPIPPDPSPVPLPLPPQPADSAPSVKSEPSKGEGKDKRSRRSESKAQGTESESEPEFKIRSDVELVLLDVSVKNSTGGFVSGLKKENFKIFEDKVAQDITVYQAQDVPVTVGLVVDNSGSIRPKKPEIVTAALTFAGKSNPHDEVFVVNFNDQVRMGLPNGIDFSDDTALLRDALLLNPAQGRTALYDGLRKALEHLNKGHLDKKTLVAIADGGDNMSETTRDEIVRDVEQSLATIYTVGIFNPGDKDKDPGFLRQLSAISGGEYYAPKKIDELVDICVKIAHDIRSRYTLGYSPKNVRFDGKVRKLKVIATDPETGKPLRVRTRTQYLAQSREKQARLDR